MAINEIKKEIKQNIKLHISCNIKLTQNKSKL